MLYAYWVVALVATVLFLFQAVSLFIGFDTDTDMSGGDVSFDADGLNLVSVKTVACFLLGFGWTGVLLSPYVANPFLLAGVALLVGLVFMLLIALLLRQVLRLSQDNSFRIEQTVGTTAEMYLGVADGEHHMGKVTLSQNGTLHELLAISRGGMAIPTGAKVKVVEVIDDQTVRVELL